MADTKATGWDAKFTEKDWLIFQEHGDLDCKCPLCKKIRRAIRKEVRRPMPKTTKTKEENASRLKEWKELPIEAFKAYQSHKSKCECDLCMKIKNFFGRDKELEEIVSKYEEE